MSRVVSVGLAGLILIVTVAAVGANAEKLFPVDEATRDATLVEFRRSLLEALEARNFALLRQALDPQIVSDLDGAAGTTAFERRWSPASPDSELWPTLRKILSMGGGFLRSEQGVQFCAPYVFTNFPEEYDIYGYGAITAKETALKQAPGMAAPSIGVLSYDIVKVNDWRSVFAPGDASQSWIKVSTLNGQEGYVPSTAIRSPTDYHACFTKTGRDWKITSLISGE